MELLMPIANRPNRKGSNEEIIRLNSVGLSLSTIAEIIGCHPTTVTLRLKSLGVEPADTRRTFMEDIVTTLSNDQQEWLVTQLGPSLPIKDFVKNLLVEKYLRSNQPSGNQP